MIKRVAFATLGLVAIIGATTFGLSHKADAKLPGPTVKLEILLPPKFNPLQPLQPPQPHGATCSGVYIGKKIIITARHCYDKDAISTTVIFDDGGSHGLKVEADELWHSDHSDIAAFRLRESVKAKSANLACRAPVIGEPIEAVGNPLGIDFVHTWGRVAGVLRSMPDPNDEPEENMVPIDAMIASGNSGGPVYDANGDVLGIADAVVDATLHGGAGHVDLMVSSLAACGMYGPGKF